MKNIINIAERLRKPARRALLSRCLTVGLLVFALVMNTGFFGALIDTNVTYNPKYVYGETSESGYGEGLVTIKNPVEPVDPPVEPVDSVEPGYKTEPDCDLECEYECECDEYSYNICECEYECECDEEDIEVTEDEEIPLASDPEQFEGIMALSVPSTVLTNSTHQWTDGNTYVLPQGTNSLTIIGEVIVTGNVTLLLEPGQTLTITGTNGANGDWSFGTGGNGGHGGNGITLSTEAHLSVDGNGTLVASGGNGGNGGGSFVTGGNGGNGGTGVVISGSATLRINQNVTLRANGGHGGDGGSAGVFGGSGGNGGNGINNAGRFEIEEDSQLDAYGAGGGTGFGLLNIFNRPNVGNRGVGYNELPGGSTNRLTFTVTFLDWDNVLISTDYTVPLGGTARPAFRPVRDEHTFARWEVISGGTGFFTDDYITGVTRDMVLRAVYNRNGRVTFQIAGGTWENGTYENITYSVTAGRPILSATSSIPVPGTPSPGRSSEGEWTPFIPTLQTLVPATGLTFTFTFKEIPFIFMPQDLDFGKLELTSDMLLYGTPVPLEDIPGGTPVGDSAVTFMGAEHAPDDWSLSLRAEQTNGSRLHEMILINNNHINNAAQTIWPLNGAGSPEPLRNITWEDLNVAIEVPNDTSLVGQHQAQLVWTVVPGTPGQP